MQTGNPDLIRDLNRTLVLNLVREVLLDLFLFAAYDHGAHTRGKGETG